MPSLITFILPFWSSAATKMHRYNRRGKWAKNKIALKNASHSFTPCCVVLYRIASFIIVRLANRKKIQSVCLFYECILSPFFGSNSYIVWLTKMVHVHHARQVEVQHTPHRKRPTKKMKRKNSANTSSTLLLRKSEGVKSRFAQRAKQLNNVHLYTNTSECVCACVCASVCTHWTLNRLSFSW